MHERGYCTYIMASRSHTLYVGVTGDLPRRIFEHKWKEHEGFTARYNCDRLVWLERYQEVHRAIAREEELKGWRRAKKIALIEGANPTWSDLSRDWYDVEPADYKRALDRMTDKGSRRSFVPPLLRMTARLREAVAAKGMIARHKPTFEDESGFIKVQRVPASDVSRKRNLFGVVPHLAGIEWILNSFQNFPGIRILDKEVEGRIHYLQDSLL